MTDATSELEAASEAIAAFYGDVVPADLAHAAHEGMANHWSAFGTPDLPASPLLLQAHRQHTTPLSHLRSAAT